MIALDTNILIYAHRSAVPEHERAREAINEACSSRKGWGIAIASVAELFAIVTHPLAAGRPSRPDEVAAFLGTLEDEGGLLIWNPGLSFSQRLIQTAQDLGVQGARVFDLQIALCAMDGGATELWTHDRGFVRVPGLRVRDPIERA